MTWLQSQLAWQALVMEGKAVRKNNETNDLPPGIHTVPWLWLGHRLGGQRSWDLRATMSFKSLSVSLCF